ncbi:MAG: hypothetical protein L6W00_14725 [Lentisphaeria bacterium]|nr:MAG: hypothetical protein L6W00_14725 [Lentisphaeria bacterium]
MIAIGIACKFLWMFIIGMLILLPAVLFFAVRGELLARRNFLRKYDSVTFLHDGLLLDGDNPKRIPREKNPSSYILDCIRKQRRDSDRGFLFEIAAEHRCPGFSVAFGLFHRTGALRRELSALA